jgi:putative ABC transport system substrate-binding protein
VARPGGNVTGLSNQASDLDAKRIELLREVVPGLRRLAIMANVGYQVAAQEMQEVETTARKSEIRRAEDIAPAFGLLKERVDALFVVTERSPPRTGIKSAPWHWTRTADDARYARVRRSGRSDVLWSKLPRPVSARRATSSIRFFVAQSQVEQPTKFDLAIDLKTAKTLGED